MRKPLVAGKINIVSGNLVPHGLNNQEKDVPSAILTFAQFTVPSIEGATFFWISSMTSLALIWQLRDFSSSFQPLNPWHLAI